MVTFINTLKKILGDQPCQILQHYWQGNFGLASKDQAASSISNRDVQNFQQFWLTLLTKDQIVAILTSLKSLHLQMLGLTRHCKNNSGEQAVAYRDKYLRSQGLRLVDGVYQNDQTLKADKALEKYIGTKQANVSSPSATAINPTSDSQLLRGSNGRRTKYRSTILY